MVRYDYGKDKCVMVTYVPWYTSTQICLMLAGNECMVKMTE